MLLVLWLVINIHHHNTRTTRRQFLTFYMPLAHKTNVWTIYTIVFCDESRESISELISHIK